MKIKITEKNRDKIEKVLEAVQKRSITRTLSVDDINHAVIHFETLAHKYEIPKRLYTGVELNICTHEKMPSAYKYPVSWTRAVILKGSTGWFLTSVYRGSGDLSIDQLYSAYWPESSALEVGKIMMNFEDWT